MSFLTIRVRLTRWRLNLIVKQVLAKAGVGATEHHGTHTLRKTFANRIFTATGKDINMTRVAMGHSQVGTTQRYLHVDDADVTRAILAVGRTATTATHAAAGGG